MSDGSRGTRGLGDRIEAIADKVKEAVAIVEEFVGPEPVSTEDPQKEPLCKLDQIQGQLVRLDKQAQYLLERVIAIQELL